MNILAGMPVFSGRLCNPHAGGKDRAALEIVKTSLNDGCTVKILPWPELPGQSHRELYFRSHRFPIPDSSETVTCYASCHAPDIATLIRHGTRCLLTHMDLEVSWYERWKPVLSGACADKEQSLAKALSFQQFDLLHCHQSYADFGRYARALNHPATRVLTHHSAGLSTELAAYDHIVFVSAFQQAWAHRRLPSLQGKTSLIYYFTAPIFHEETQPSQGEAIAFSGLLSDNRKGCDLLLAAYRNFPELHRHPLHIIGDGKNREDLEDFARENNLPATFHGGLEQTAVPEILRQCRAFVMPSRGEGLAFAYLEALCMGLPVVGYPPNVNELSYLLGQPAGIPYNASRGDLRELRDAILNTVDVRPPFTASDRSNLMEAAQRQFSIERFRQEYSRLFDRFSDSLPKH